MYESSRSAPERTLEVIGTYPHDLDAFTQGLFFHESFLYEGTGLHGASSLRKVALETGEVLERVDLPDNLFGEGIALSNGRILQLTWRSKLGLIYDLETMTRTGEFHYETEGWGLAAQGDDIVMSDGTATLRWLDPRTFEVTRSLVVRDGKHPVSYLNELEFVNGHLYANIWKSHRVAVIDPVTGRVLEWLSLEILPEARGWRADGSYVANGIAWDDQGRRLFVTGKNWSKVYEIARK